jgi:hypothetical protein
MFRPGTDETNVQMSDVLCDFCHRPWTEDVALIEGHRGCMICGHCLAVGYAELVVRGAPGPAEYACTMCREDDRDRAALDRAGEPGWASPAHPESVICSRCARQASEALAKDPDHDWTLPSA